MKNTTSPNEKLVEIRADIEHVNGQLLELKSEFVSKADVASRIDTFIEIQSEKLETSESLFVSANINGTGITPGIFVNQETMISESEAVRTNVAPCLAALFPEQLKDFLLKKIDSNCGGRYGRAMADRPGIKSQLLKKRFDLEVKEESLVVQIETTGAEVSRRHDIANPLIVIIDPAKLQAA